MANDLEIDLRNKIANLGLEEIKSFTFIYQKKIIHESDYMDVLEIVNPLSKDLSIMRNSLYPNLLDAVSRNYAKGFDSFSMFEIGDIFKGIGYSKQEKIVGLVFSGFHVKKNWHYKRRQYDFFDMKGIILEILKTLCE